MLRPTWISTQTRPQSATLLLLYDRSRSMQVEDAAGGVSRWVRLQTRAGLGIRTGPAVAQPGTARLQLCRPITDERGAGRQSSACHRIRRSTNQSRRGSGRGPSREIGKRLAAVILLSDGAQRTYEPRVDLQQVARDLARWTAPSTPYRSGNLANNPRRETSASKTCRISTRSSSRTKWRFGEPCVCRATSTVPFRFRSWWRARTVRRSNWVPSRSPSRRTTRWPNSASPTHRSSPDRTRCGLKRRRNRVN